MNQHDSEGNPQASFGDSVVGASNLGSPLAHDPADEGQLSDQLIEAIRDCVGTHTKRDWTDLGSMRVLPRRADLERSIHQRVIELLSAREARLRQEMNDHNAREAEENMRAGVDAAFYALLDFVDQVDGIAAQSAALTDELGFVALTRSIDRIYQLNGYRRIPTVNCAFNPILHIHVGAADSLTIPRGHVVREIQRGYHRNNTPLRAASVIVSRGKGNT